MNHRLWHERDVQAMTSTDVANEHNLLFTAYQDMKARRDVAENRAQDTLDENNRLDRELDEARQRLAKTAAKSARRRTAIKQLQSAHDGWQRLAKHRFDTCVNVKREAMALRAELEAVKAERDDFKKRYMHVAELNQNQVSMVRKAESELAARQPMPVKVHWSVTAEQAFQAWVDSGKAGVESCKVIMDYLAAHAVIDVPTGVPSTEELGKLAYDTMYPTPSLNWNAETKAKRDNWIRTATAIRNATLAGMATLAWTDDQIEALARVLHEAYTKTVSWQTCWNELNAAARLSRIDQARAAVEFMRVGPPEPIATPETLEELTEIGNRAFDVVMGQKSIPLSEMGHGIPEASLAQTAAILRAAQAYVDVTAHDLRLLHAEHSDATDWFAKALDWCNSRIRYRVASPEMPKELPSAPDLIAQVGTDLSIPHDEKFSPYSDRGWEYTRAILAALRPWLHTPTGWELDTPEGGWLSEGFCIYNPATGESHSLESFVSHVCSRIRPTFECVECEQWRKDWDSQSKAYEILSKSNSKACKQINTIRAALEGE